MARLLIIVVYLAKLSQGSITRWKDHDVCTEVLVPRDVMGSTILFKRSLEESKKMAGCSQNQHRKGKEYRKGKRIVRDKRMSNGT